MESQGSQNGENYLGFPLGFKKEFVDKWHSSVSYHGINEQGKHVLRCDLCSAEYKKEILYTLKSGFSTAGFEKDHDGKKHAHAVKSQQLKKNPKGGIKKFTQVQTGPNKKAKTEQSASASSQATPSVSEQTRVQGVSSGPGAAATAATGPESGPLAPQSPPTAQATAVSSAAVSLSSAVSHHPSTPLPCHGVCLVRGMGAARFKTLKAQEQYTDILQIYHKQEDAQFKIVWGGEIARARKQIHTQSCTTLSTDKEGHHTFTKVREYLPSGMVWWQCSDCSILEGMGVESPVQKQYTGLMRFMNIENAFEFKVQRPLAGVMVEFSEEEEAQIWSFKSFKQSDYDRYNREACEKLRDRIEAHEEYRKIFSENKKLKAEIGEISADSFLAKFLHLYREKKFLDPFLQMARCLTERLSGNKRAPLGEEWQTVVIAVSAHSAAYRKLLQKHLVAHTERHEYRLHQKWGGTEKVPIPPATLGEEPILAALVTTLDSIAAHHGLTKEQPGECGILSDSTTLLKSAMKVPYDDYIVGGTYGYHCVPTEQGKSI
uniref:Uncharacterized protein n=1 Tax=Chromera velia CCMP2878 TaxID=1169474 RepID=A0A0G4HZ98_9ALVE|eukprot:Cvel_9682.t1-p1 / transcript=Cvel_9682.t1 / gene=Cvel_9682 / organism=Chromera_velia_CCMP2878 / gene_product=hypothetical protein / transcript_product=hypothetical protein / location=Cvel_scaffold564:25647-27278(-) / protein_length=544 / sequence_SO=supercontig / SO=protein_coding / is_pseudo=false